MESGLKHRVLIVGGGFGGIKTALELAGHENVAVTLVSDKTHFEYHAALYRVVTGRSPLEVCIPLSEIFAGRKVEIVEDRITSVDTDKNVVSGEAGRQYQYDSLVLALGSETVYFDIPGLEKLSFGFKSITEALELKSHLHQVMTTCSSQPSQDEKVCSCHIVVVGGGASGVEVAGELSVYARKLAREHGLDQSLVTVDLIEAAPRLLPGLPENTSRVAKERLGRLGVNVYLNRALVKEEIESVYLKDMKINTKTVIWTAGVKPNRLYGKVKGLEFDKKGRVVVDQFLRPKTLNNVYILGDAAATKFSGMAQTALKDGELTAENILRSCASQPLRPYQPSKPVYAIPIGPGWAATVILGTEVYGQIGWFFRRLADLEFFLSILPLPKAWSAFANGRTICETCNICVPEEKPTS